MIIGISLRHYKKYNNINFIPVTTDINNSLSLFIGNNGVGKSSVLEALNTFFNNGHWNRTKNEKQDQTFICPILLINKQEFNDFFKLNSNDKQALDIISNYLFNLIETTSKENIEFVKIKDNLKVNIEEYYLIIIGNTYKDRNKAYFGSSFDNEIRNRIEEQLPNYRIDQILHRIKQYYTYIYIPVESKTDDILKLEATEMQKLMNRNILETIESVLNEKRFKQKGKTANINLVSVMNDTLNNFMDEINSHIRLIDENYSFKVEDGYKRNLTAADLREQILKSYFSIRTLKKDGKEIFELSSGEQRIALIDIATAFIKNRNNIHNRGITILAIDEPEASLHISRCFNQFKRIEELSFQANTQILLTTHWYGSIPTMQNGTLNHINDGSKVEINSFPLTGYLEKRRAFPDDIDLKSFFELVSTIISSIKSEKTKWLIIEGSDDYMYYKHYLSNKIDDLVILPTGGCGNVIKIYEYLFAPFSEKIEKGILKKSKVLCLIDSDIEQKTTKLINSAIENCLKIARIQNFNNNISLSSIQGTGNYYPTTIEDCLNPSLFYEAASLAMQDEEKNIKKLFDGFKQNDEAVSSRIKGDDSLLTPKSLDVVNKKPTLIEAMNKPEFKMRLAKHYCERSTQTTKHTNESPMLFNLVIDFFNS